MGPLLMAGLTDGERGIAADPAAVADLLSDVTNEGLVSIRIPGDVPTYLCREGSRLVLCTNATVPGLDAVFRIMQENDRHAFVSNYAPFSQTLLHRWGLSSAMAYCLALSTLHVPAAHGIRVPH